MSDLVDALRRTKLFPNGGAVYPPTEVLHAAADEIIRLQKLVEEMTEALVFYSHEPAYSSTWETRSCGCCSDEIEPEVFGDKGQLARDILSKALSNKEETK